MTPAPVAADSTPRYSEATSRAAWFSDDRPCAAAEAAALLPPAGASAGGRAAGRRRGRRAGARRRMLPPTGARAAITPPLRPIPSQSLPSLAGPQAAALQLAAPAPLRRSGRGAPRRGPPPQNAPRTAARLLRLRRAPCRLLVCIRTFMVSSGWIVLWDAARAIAPATTSWAGLPSVGGGAGGADDAAPIDVSGALTAVACRGRARRGSGHAGTAIAHGRSPGSAIGGRRRRRLHPAPGRRLRMAGGCCGRGCLQWRPISTNWHARRGGTGLGWALPQAAHPCRCPRSPRAALTALPRPPEH
jgi:hypothetical protein